MTNGPAKPKHLRLTETFRRQILNGAWPVGTVIPTEVELCRRFAVSRTTIRKALERLAREGLVERRRKMGTLVRAFSENAHVWRLKSEVINYSYPEGMTSEILSAETVARDINRELLQGYEGETSISRIRLRRSLGDTPFALVFAYVPAQYVDAILGEFNAASGNYIFLIMERLTGRPVCQAQDTFDATLAVGEVAQRLRVAPGAPLFYVQRRLLDQGGQLVQATEIFMRPDLHKLRFVHTKEIRETDRDGA